MKLPPFKRVLKWLLIVTVVLILIGGSVGLGVWYVYYKPTLSVDLAMSDGTSLRTYVFNPDGEGPWPVVLVRTPYPYSMMVSIIPPSRYTDVEYSYVLQSCRGTGKSGGDYYPFSHARSDAQDTLDWLVEQPYFDGNIGLTGISAMGITANMTASLQHDAVKAAFVSMAPQSSFSESTFIGGVFKENQVSEWMALQNAADEVEGLRARPVWDEQWDELDFSAYLPKVNIPVYNVGGWYDIFLRGNLENFVYLQEQGVDGARGNQKLSVGAFGHLPMAGELAYPKLGTKFGPMMGDDELRWFDYWLKDIDNGIMDEPPVKYYMMAAARGEDVSKKNRVIEDAHWPPSSKETRYYLQADKSLTTTAPAEESSYTDYPFDPENPVPTFGGSNLFMARGPMDQRDVGQREDYLRFETPPLTEDVTVSGRVTMEVFASTDGLDTDFMVKLIDVYPDGYEALLLDAPIRTRYRNGFKSEDVAFMTPGIPEKMSIDLWGTANTFEVGHRIAVHVTSSNAPRFEVNPNTGHAPGDASKEARVARNAIYHSSAMPSAIVLPVLTNTKGIEIAAVQ